MTPGAIDLILLMISFISIGAGIASSGIALSISMSAYAACDAERRGAAFIPAVMAGSQGLYSFAIAFLMIQALPDAWEQSSTLFKISAAGPLCGIPCLLSALGQAKTAAACIKSINQGTMTTGGSLLAAGMPEFYALVGLGAGFLVMQ
jgi:F0F1-type ATP synthase membrane subunit c/vacuolar-type H+-ATPase subunit K